MESPNDQPIDMGQPLIDSFYPVPPPDFKRFNTEIAETDQGPRLDWIEDQGGWSSFGQNWPLEESLPSLEDVGVTRLYDDDMDRREALRVLLRTCLFTYVQLLNSLLAGPPTVRPPSPSEMDPNDDGITEDSRLISHLRLCAINMHHLCNEMRPVQARETLEEIMREKIANRKRKTEEINKSCERVESIIAKLSTSYSLDERLPMSEDERGDGGVSDLKKMMDLVDKIG